MKYRIYYDSTRKTFSIKQKGKVVKKSNFIIGDNCELIVSEKTRNRVLLLKRKTPHAYIETNSIRFSAHDEDEIQELLKSKEFKYNPYKHGYFYEVIHEKPVKKYKKVFLYIIDGKAVCYGTNRIY